MTRSEWLAGFALLLSAASMIWTGGVVYGQVQDHEKRIEQVETDMRPLGPALVEIRADVKYLRERAQEDRERQERSR